ncbi:MAG: glycosyltransferase family 4 protein [Steroidobacteraceae bacterium]
MTPPHVCFVGLLNLPVLAPEYADRPAGGAELQQVLLAKTLARRGWPVSMVVLDWGQPDGATWHGVRTIKTYRPQEGLPGLRFLYPRWTKLLRALRRADADIYYASCAGGHLAQLVLFAQPRRRKVVFRVASNSDCDPRELLVRHRRDRLLYRYGLARADLVLAQTAQQQDALWRNYRRSSRLAPSLIEPPERCRALPERDIDVLWVGHIRSFKRPQLLLEAARRLPRIRFHMVGGRMPGSEELFDSLRLQALGLANMTFHGAVPYRQTRALYERARLFISTSAIEGFPNTYLQSWSHGTPVLAFLDPDRLIERFRIGRVVRTVEEMCAAIAALSHDPAQWALASARAREYMQRHCDERYMLSPYIAALTGLREAGTGGPQASEAPVARG